MTITELYRRNRAAWFGPAGTRELDARRKLYGLQMAAFWTAGDVLAREHGIPDAKATEIGWLAGEALECEPGDEGEELRALTRFYRRLDGRTASGWAAAA